MGRLLIFHILPFLLPPFKFFTTLSNHEPLKYELLQIHRLKFKDLDGNLRDKLKKAEAEMAAAGKDYEKIKMDLKSKTAH